MATSRSVSVLEVNAVNPAYLRGLLKSLQDTTANIHHGRDELDHGFLLTLVRSGWILELVPLFCHRFSSVESLMSRSSIQRFVSHYQFNISLPLLGISHLLEHSLELK